jgi:hypothetical protein
MKKQLFFLWISLFSSSLYAEIEWTRTHQEIIAEPVQLHATVFFPFKVSGNQPVEFLSLRPSCGCLSIYPEKKQYQPGEEGVLKVVFNLEGRTGAQKKSIKVITSDHPNQPVQLFITAQIPEGYRFSSKRLLWQTEESGTPKTITFTNTSPKPIQIGKITSSHARIELDLKPIRPGFEYLLTLTPEKQLHQARSVIRIQTIPPSGETESKSYKLYLHIK